VNSQDEIVNGFLIPKGSLINLNNGYVAMNPNTLIMLKMLRFMLTDPNVWGDPDMFRPERFLEAGASDLPNPMTLIFGYGMRHVLHLLLCIISSCYSCTSVCPGMYLADRAGFNIAATTIALYKIVPLEGAEIPDPDTIEYTDTAFR
jgi:hypothetical protein